MWVCVSALARKSAVRGAHSLFARPALAAASGGCTYPRVELAAHNYRLAGAGGAPRTPGAARHTFALRFPINPRPGHGRAKGRTWPRVASAEPTCVRDHEGCFCVQEECDIIYWVMSFLVTKSDIMLFIILRAWESYFEWDSAGKWLSSKICVTIMGLDPGCSFTEWVSLLRQLFCYSLFYCLSFHIYTMGTRRLWLICSGNQWGNNWFAIREALLKSVYFTLFLHKKISRMLRISNKYLKYSRLH